MSREGKIKDIEDEIKKTQYNKATQHHVGLLKAKIAKLKDESEQIKKGKGKTDGYQVKRSGDATVVMVGFPSVGKSTILNKITNANSKVAAYEFTTLTVIPGLLEYNHAKIQVLDVPGIVQGAADGTGRGKEVLGAVRSADMILLILDVSQLGHLKTLEREIYNSGLRINQKKPDVVIRKTTKGGISISSTVPLKVDRKTIAGMFNEFKIINADVLIRSPVNEDQVIDCIGQNKKYLPALIVLNKIDTVSESYLEELKKKFPQAAFISADRGVNIEDLKKKIFEKLEFMRVFLKQPGLLADMKEPLIMKSGSSL
jgi:small GTP-binding protein